MFCFLPAICSVAFRLTAMPAVLFASHQYTPESCSRLFCITLCELKWNGKYQIRNYLDQKTKAGIFFSNKIMWVFCVFFIYFFLRTKDKNPFGKIPEWFWNKIIIIIFHLLLCYFICGKMYVRIWLFMKI